MYIGRKQPDPCRLSCTPQRFKYSSVFVIQTDRLLGIQEKFSNEATATTYNNPFDKEL